MDWGRSALKGAIETQIKLAAEGSETERRADFTGLSWREKRNRLWKAQYPNGPEPVDVWPSLAEIFHGWFTLGRDFGGVSLMSERRAWLDENGYTEAGERSAILELFNVLEATAAENREILYPTPKGKK